MNPARTLVVAVACCAIPAWLPAQSLKPKTVQEFECYVQSAESRMNSRKAFLVADSDNALAQQLVRSGQVETLPGNGVNPHKISGAMVFDWIGTIFIPKGTVDRTIRMLQDYDHRAQYFTEVMSSSKLLCRGGVDQFGFVMRMKEPAVLDVESDVVWERLDARRWKCRSYSTKIQEIGGNHGYLLRLNSYWRFLENADGVFVEGETVTLSGEFGAFKRAIGSMLMGINPEKSLKKSLESIKDAVLNSKLEFAAPPAGIETCKAPVRIKGCPAESTR
jgi:hypothetical protein